MVLGGVVGPRGRQRTQCVYRSAEVTLHWQAAKPRARSVSCHLRIRPWAGRNRSEGTGKMQTDCLLQNTPLKVIMAVWSSPKGDISVCPLHFTGFWFLRILNELLRCLVSERQKWQLRPSHIYKKRWAGQGFCKEIKKVALNGQGGKQGENLLGKWGKHLPFLQPAAHATTETAPPSWRRLTSLSHRSLRYHPFIYRSKRGDPGNGRGFPNTQTGSEAPGLQNRASALGSLWFIT